MKLSPFKQKIQQHYDTMAPERRRWKKKNRYYYEYQERTVKFLVEINKKVLVLGCGTGELLAALEPSYGVGIDLSAGMLKIARESFPHIEFIQGDMEDPSTWGIKQVFNYIVLDDSVGLAEDVQKLFTELHPFCSPETRIVVTYYNYLWEAVLTTAAKVGLRMPQLNQSWLSMEDLENLLFLSDFETVKRDSGLLIPKKIFGLSRFFEFFGSLPAMNKLCLCYYLVARPLERKEVQRHRGVSVIIPCRNEHGNIEVAVKRLPEMGTRTEFIFVDGHSTDGTQDEIKRVMAEYPEKDITFLVQDDIGKGEAVRKGFASATQDILMILDADLTVPPEDLPKFYDAIIRQKGEFINGCRLVYPMRKMAMRFLNILGNKFFSLVFTWLLNQRIKDTLCGTKVLSKQHYDQIASNRDYFGEFDPFGDFDLLFGASKLNLKILEVPVRYKARTYGETQISRFRHGWLLLRMCMFAIRKLKMHT